VLRGCKVSLHQAEHMRCTSIPTRQTLLGEYAPPSKNLCTTCCSPKRSPPSAQSSLQSVQHFRLRIQQARIGVCKVVCSESAKAAKQIKVEAKAQATFANYVSSSRNKLAGAAATELLQQAATSQKVQPYLALGAALWVEQHSASNTGAESCNKQHCLRCFHDYMMHMQHCSADTLVDLDGRWQLVSWLTVYVFRHLFLTM